MKKVIPKWVRDWPKEEGWYWVKYPKGAKAPASVMYHDFAKTISIRTCFGDTFIAGPYHGKLANKFRFGPKIEVPNG